MNQLTVDIGTTNMSIGLTYLYVGHRHNALLFRHMSDTPKYVCPVFHYSPFYFTPQYILDTLDTLGTLLGYTT